ncbi:MAG: DUF5684 domain-containing protein [Lachnospiraceae bacterium]|nr:DUF5684 domain-containing protein [Lachnospiraceae bacterium]
MEAIAGMFSGATALVSLVVMVVMIVAMWKIFEKAGEAGWKSLIPFYNTYILFKIAWGNGLLFLLCLVPCVNIVVLFIMYWKLCKAFDQGIGMYLLMLFVSPVAWLVLGFGSAQYIGPQ